MALREAFAIVNTADVTRLAIFYVEQLGFDRGYIWPDETDPAFIVVTLDAFSIGLSKSEDLAPIGRFAFWLYADDVDQEVERLRREGVAVVSEPRDTAWGERMATVSDPDGTPIHIGQRT